MALVICMLIVIITSNFRTAVTDTNATELVVRCTGELSTLTHDDCKQEKYWNTTGCFYMPHFSQYIPCNYICDGIGVESVDEDKCRNYCPDFLRFACRGVFPISGPTKSQAQLTPKQMERDVMLPSQTTNKTFNTGLLVGIIVPVLVTLLLVIALVVIFLKYISSRSNRFIKKSANSDRLGSMRERGTFIHPVQASGTNDTAELRNVGQFKPELFDDDVV